MFLLCLLLYCNFLTCAYPSTMFPSLQRYCGTTFTDVKTGYILRLSLSPFQWGVALDVIGFPRSGHLICSSAFRCFLWACLSRYSLLPPVTVKGCSQLATLLSPGRPYISVISTFQSTRWYRPVLSEVRHLQLVSVNILTMSSL